MNISHPDLQISGPKELHTDEVHLWRVDLGAVAPGERRWYEMLSLDERERAERFSSLQSRQTFISTRTILRFILSVYVHAKPEALIFSYSNQKKPFLDSPHLECPIEFSVSHSCNLALLAFARARPVGVDVEHIGRDLDHELLAKRFFSPSERVELNALPASERHLAFLRVWTRKEAYLKAVGTGLTQALDQFDISSELDEDNVLSIRTGLSDPYCFRNIPAGEDYVAALCVQGQGCRLESWLANL